MASLTELDFNYKRFLDKTTLLFGESGTGKSFIMVDILYHLQAHVEQIIVISPMDRQNSTYKDIVPLPCIHYTITPQLLTDLWDRQKALAAIYADVNRLSSLKSLFDKLQSAHAQEIIDNIYKKLRKYKEEIMANDQDDRKITELQQEYENFVRIIYKDIINKNRDQLSKMNLTDVERRVLKYINMNPRMVLILDDCTDLLKKYKTNDVMQKLFYQGRWNYITTIIACHTDKALEPELKKNSFVNIFTDETCAHAYFERKSNDLDRDAKTRAMTAVKAAFTPLAKYQKLAWIREEKKFYRFTATTRSKFKFGSQYIWEFCNRIQADASSGLSPTNKFINDFI